MINKESYRWKKSVAFTLGALGLEIASILYGRQVAVETEKACAAAIRIQLLGQELTVAGSAGYHGAPYSPYINGQMNDIRMAFLTSKDHGLNISWHARLEEMALTGIVFGGSERRDLKGIYTDDPIPEGSVTLHFNCQGLQKKR